MTKTLGALILACSLAGCAGGTPSPTDTRNQTDRTLPPGEGALGGALTWELHKKEQPPAATAPAAPAASAPGTPQGSNERQEFEDWRAWQKSKQNK